MIVVRKPTKQEIELAKTWPIWSKEKSTFLWEYNEKEICMIIKGRAKVTYHGGSTEFGEGDFVIFPKGLKCTWKIIEDIKKYYQLVPED